jgi:hypothetical protein
MANLRNQRRISRSSRRLSSRPAVAEIPAISIDPYSSCPPEPPGYDGNWYKECMEILGIR